MNNQSTGSGEAGGIPRITGARAAHSDEMRARMIKYTVSMSIRMVCLFMLFFVQGWMIWVVVVGAVILPWFAVVIANGGSDTRNMTASDAMISTPPQQEIGATAPPPAAAEDRPETAVLRGEIIEDHRTDEDDDDKA